MAKGSASKAAAELAGMLGPENVSTDELDLILYSRDMAPMPDDLMSSYGMIEPDVVVRPGTAEEVASVLRWAAERNIPVTPRSGGSWALGGTIPIEGGVVLDLSRMNRIIEINEADRYARVEGCVIWKRLSDVLEREGLRVGTYPSSAPSAAVAGFVATGGSGGIGASLHGPVGDQVLSLKVALSDGRVVETDPWSSWLFTGSEGTLGVICEVVLKVFPIEPMYHAMLAFDDLGEAWKAFRRLKELRPYFLTFLDRGFANALNRASAGEGLPVRAAARTQTGHPPTRSVGPKSPSFAEAPGLRSRSCFGGVGSDGGLRSLGEGRPGANAPGLPERAVAFVACFTGSESELAKVRDEIEKSWPDQSCGQELARHEWENRFDAVLSTKGLGPTIFSPEIQVPISELARVFDELEDVIADRDHAVEGMATGGDAVTILPVIYTDERDASDFLKVFSYTRDITDIAYRRGGCVYGIGLHNSGHMGLIHGAGHEVMRSVRSEVEPSNCLNPSKTTQVRVPYYLLRIAMSFMGGLPWLVAAGLRLARAVPRPLLRFGLRIVGSQQR